jgi:hypothetical protein
MATFKITGDLKGCTERYRNNHTMNQNDTKKVNNGDINWSSIFYFLFCSLFCYRPLNIAPIVFA